MIIWITGLSGAGKTTLAVELKKQLKNKRYINTILLDGDEVRNIFKWDGYTLKERKKVAYGYARLAKLLSDQEFYVIVATISMFEDVREWNRNNNKHYLEVYLKVSKEELKKRDQKNIYAAKKDVVSISSIYEEPKNSDIVFDNKRGFGIDIMTNIIVDKLYKGIEYED